ncbi:VOC family protein [Cupriavidus basilensis]|uniref:VOC family protein n=1 Tax=Cupriavidus basilensis TaxID=68895 RepID=UPI0023E7D892|nr:VOC family protein [Cupriavidus basilensis]MDF3888805.1 VOC family protein [Cupriavidus basilensis]
MTGSVSYLEIGGQDARVSQDFFRQLFDWPFQPTELAGEGWFQAPSIRVGLHGNDPEPQVLVFFRVTDMLAAVSRVKALGGHADDAGPGEPGFGLFRMCRDPQGVKFGLHQSVAS